MTMVSPDDTIENDNNDDDVQPYPSSFTTKDNKRLVFDGTRFFETNDDDDDDDDDVSAQVVTSRAQSMYVQELPVVNYDASRYKPTDMIPTEELFGPLRKSSRLQSQDGGKNLDLLDLECNQEECDVVDYDNVDNKSGNAGYDSLALIPGDFNPKDALLRTAMEKAVLTCYQAWNARDMQAVVKCFARDFTYHDGQYRGSFTNQSELQRHFASQAQLLPSRDCQMVVDHMAVDVVRRHVATQWHVQRSSTGDKVPLTSGISFYTLTKKDGTKIATGRRVSEMWIKPPPAVANAVTALASFLMGNTSNNATFQSTGHATKSSKTKSSIIEEYFDAWNRRDMEAAMACFVDDCRYQTEDPVFVDAFSGKAALRAHLDKNAASLPGSARIVLDDLAIDDTNGKIGTTWHLQIMEENDEITNGSSLLLPTLRGCSMYTTDPTTGLLVTGYDVTEALAKLPRASTVWLAGPAKWLFNRKR